MRDTGEYSDGLLGTVLESLERTGKIDRTAGGWRCLR